MPSRERWVPLHCALRPAGDLRLIDIKNAAATTQFAYEEGRADYQLYLQGDACRPFPITIRGDGT